MQILLIRHAIAEDRLAFAQIGQPDALRPLSLRGRERMQQATKGLQELIPEIHYLISSPLTRAIQTANILYECYPQARREQWNEVAPGQAPELLAARLSQLPEQAVVALIGHEPDLSGLLAWLITGSERPFTQLKKGSALLLDSTGAPYKGRAALLWALTPRQLRKLGNR